ncbi:S41 family peptidase [Anaerovorax odorimutans]|uniref:S41 family peptidase n=1 Tax=Anaerovorax odorimutans TaxID=109327 RepID=UPI0005691FBF|nr:S41 family peptidase [Anaerovorax odorimutans]
MLMMKKRNFLFLMIIAVLIGALITAGVVYFIGTMSGGYVSITKDDYEKYKLMKSKYGKLDELQSYIDKNYYIPPDEKKLEEGMYKGLFWGLGDPYSSYLTADEYEQMKVAITGEYGGVGVTIAADDEGYITVVAPMDDSPADKAGIETGDRIIKIDGKAYDSLSLDKAASVLRGKAGTKVDVTILRGKETLECSLTRANIVTHTVKAKTLDDNIGYIRITGFEENTADEFSKELRNFEKKEVKGLVIDLRDNGGGLVNIGVDIADLLLPEGVVTYTKDRNGERYDYKSKTGATSLPFVVLVNGGTASTSEILTSAIKDYKAGKIIGTTTFGKGIIQSIEQLDNGDALKLTVMQYFSPKGNVIHEKGVEPDIVVEALADDKDDVQLKKAVEVLEK